MGKKDDRVDAYISKAADFAKPVLIHLRRVVHTACPDVEETWKWSFPNFMYKGSILCTMAAFKSHCSFGFWKASLLPDTDNILTNRDKDGMGHLGKIESLADLPADEVLIKYIQAGMQLNDAGVKLPPRAKVTEKEKKEMEVPAYFTEALETSPAAKEKFNAFSYSHKKEYIEWFEEAKTEATRNKRMTQALDWIENGKSRNWKYAC
jgi:uncharacterized protein YdeI (YjbR/CyaY-like superfamily)